MKELKKDLVKIVESPFDEIKKHGDILTISEKVGSVVFRNLFGVPIKYVLLPLGASLVLPLVIVVEVILAAINGEEKIKEEEKRIDLSEALFKIKKIVNLSEENIPQGTKDDIYFFFKIENNFTEESLTEAYKNCQKKYHPDRWTGNREKWDECEKLYNEMIWHWFKSTDEKLTNNYPKLRQKSYRHHPEFGVNQLVIVDNKTHKINGRILRTSSFDGDNYLIVDNSTGLPYEVQQEDIKYAQ
jgi:hypothetical protein